MALASVNSLRSTLGAFRTAWNYGEHPGDPGRERGGGEKVIRDADIARETIRFTRNQILVNAGAARLRRRMLRRRAR